MLFFFFFFFPPSFFRPVKEKALNSFLRPTGFRSSPFLSLPTEFEAGEAFFLFLCSDEGGVQAAHSSLLKESGKQKRLVLLSSFWDRTSPILPFPSSRREGSGRERNPLLLSFCPAEMTGRDPLFSFSCQVTAWEKHFFFFLPPPCPASTEGEGPVRRSFFPSLLGGKGKGRPFIFSFSFLRR